MPIVPSYGAVLLFDMCIETELRSEQTQAMQKARQSEPRGMVTEQHCDWGFSFLLIWYPAVLLSQSFHSGIQFMITGQ